MPAWGPTGLTDEEIWALVGYIRSEPEAEAVLWEMNQIAEDGIAAHWLYKSGSDKINKDDFAIAWLKNLIDWQKDLTDSTEFFEFFKIDLFHAEIFVFTPKGDLITLPKGATILDFAFAVHTDLGLHCIGAKVDGKIQPISKELKSGQTVEILRLNSKKPSIDWLLENGLTPKYAHLGTSKEGRGGLGEQVDHQGCDPVSIKKAVAGLR